MASQKRKPRMLTIQFHATDEELADIHGQLDALVDRLVCDDMGLAGRVINLDSHDERTGRRGSPTTSPKQIMSSQ